MHLEIETLTPSECLSSSGVSVLIYLHPRTWSRGFVFPPSPSFWPFQTCCVTETNYHNMVTRKYILNYTRPISYTPLRHVRDVEWDIVAWKKFYLNLAFLEIFKTKRPKRTFNPSGPGTRGRTETVGGGLGSLADGWAYQRWSPSKRGRPRNE